MGVMAGLHRDIWATAAQGRYGFSALARYEGLAPAMLDLQSRPMPTLRYSLPVVLRQGQALPTRR